MEVVSETGGGEADRENLYSVRLHVTWFRPSLCRF
jgi:hypothetical protein